VSVIYHIYLYMLKLRHSQLVQMVFYIGIFRRSTTPHSPSVRWPRSTRGKPAASPSENPFLQRYSFNV